MSQTVQMVNSPKMVIANATLAQKDSNVLSKTKLLLSNALLEHTLWVINLIAKNALMERSVSIETHTMF